MTERLGAVPAGLSAARRAAALRRAAITALCLQLVLLPVFSLLSALRPYEALWLQCALATWLAWSWPLFRWLQGAKPWLSRTRRAALEQAGATVVATELDRLNPAAPDVFRTALQPEIHSPETRVALEVLYAAWEPRLCLPDVPPVLAGRSGAVRRRILTACAVFAVFTAASPLILPGVFEKSGTPFAVLYRMALPLRAWNAIPAPRLRPVAVRARIVRGDTLSVTVLTEHVPPGRPVHARVVVGKASAGSGEVRHTLVRNATGDTAWFRFGPVRSDFTVRFTALDAGTRAYAVHAVVPPRLHALSAVLTPPAYTRLPVETLEDFPPALAVLPGTRIAWKGEADRSLREWAAAWDEGAEDAGGRAAGQDRNPVSIARGSGSYPGFSRVIRSAGVLRIHLTDAEEEGGARATEGPWRIDLKPDEPPEIALLAPSGDGELSRVLKVPVLFRAADDFGIARVRLHYAVREDAEGGGESAGEGRGARARAEGFRDITAWRDPRDGTGGGVWDAAALRPGPGDVLELYLEAEDNDAVSGHKVARSATVRLRLPSEEEVREAVEERERNAATSLSSALERERRARQEENKAERPDRANAEAPPIAGEWEVRRILSEQPRQHLQELRAQLDAEARAMKSAAPRTSDAGGADPRADGERNQAQVKALEELRKDVEAMEKRVPSPEVSRAPVAEQQRRLESLNRDQKTLEKKLAETRPPSPKPEKNAANPASPQASPEKRAAENRQENRARLEDDLQRNIKEQKDLQNWLQERERAEAAQQKRLEAAAKNSERMEQDVEKALEQVKEAMEKGLENGTLSPDILEKMDRVRELLEEVLDEGEKDRLRQEAGEQRPEAGDLQRAMRDLLEKKDGIRQDLERAIRMLEAMREVRALKELSGDVREMEKDQRALAADLGKESPPEKAAMAERVEERAEEQKMLEKRLDNALKEMDRLSKNPSMRSVGKDDARKARDAMQKTSDKLREKKSDPKASKAGADLAARHLQAAAQEMEKTLAKLEAGSDMAEIRAVLEETLEFARWLDERGGLALPAPPRWSPPAAPAASGAPRVALWLAARMQRLAEKRPFDSEVLRREAGALAAFSAAADASFSADSLRVHARGAARELLKWLSQSQEGGGDEEGDGQGDSEFGGGESGESGKEGMSGRMRGVSGKQMAANQMTQELLRSLLRQRQESGSPGQGMPGGAGQPGSRGKPQGSGGTGSGSSPGQGKPGGSGEGRGAGSGPGSESGEPGETGEDGGEQDGAKSGAAANAQQQVAQALESLAEAADDAGGAARKLRQLAAEARALERELRGERPDPALIQKRQEQFRTRLLEAADAMEERGRQQERRAEAWKGGVRIPENAGSLGMDSLATELKRRRAEARKLPLTPAQKQRVEWYYERLLGP